MYVPMASTHLIHCTSHPLTLSYKYFAFYDVRNKISVLTVQDFCPSVAFMTSCKKLSFKVQWPHLLKVKGIDFPLLYTSSQFN